MARSVPISEQYADTDGEHEYRNGNDYRGGQISIDDDFNTFEHGE